MAISFSRPDPSSPTAVAGATFGTSRKGFDQQEVREFLRMVSAELGRLQERERFLERELRSAQAASTGELTTIDEDTATRLLGEETARILTTARESGAAIKAKAEDAAAKLLKDATDEATRMRQEADVESARRRRDAAADAEAELAMAKQQGREMVEEARAYRERVLSELARRRELARQQIDQLISSRDQLVQIFERARLVASDIVGQLAPLDQPEELIDLSPTTGPVPVTTPAGRIGDRSAVADSPMPSEARLADDEPAHPFVRDATGAIPVVTAPDPEEDVDEGEAIDAPAASDELTVQPAELGAEVDGDAAEADDAVEPAGPGAGEPEVEDDPATEAEPTAETEPNSGSKPVPESEPAPEGESAREPAATNVVAFPAPATAAATAAPPVGESSDVDQIFARLRAGRPEPPQVEEAVEAAEAAEAEPSAAVDSGTADEDASDDDELETPFTAREAVIVPLIVTAARKLKRRLADEQNEILDALRRNEPVADPEALVGTDHEQITRYADAITAELAEAGQAGADAIGGTEPIDLGPDGLLGPAHEAIATELVGPLRERLARAIEEADGDRDTIAKKVRGVYREWKSQRIDDELDDIVRGAYIRAAYASLAPGSHVRWIVDPDGPASPDCEDNSLAEPVAVGDGFPTGHTNPPAHPGCRCLLAVVES